MMKPHVLSDATLMTALAEGRVTVTGRTPSEPAPQFLPSPDGPPVPIPLTQPDRLKLPDGATTLQDIADTLKDPTAHGLTPVPGRTLPKGYQWFGFDIPGRGGAAARRLRQQEKLAAQKGTPNALPDPSAD